MISSLAYSLFDHIRRTALQHTRLGRATRATIRAKIRRVSRWRPETRMAPKWLAYALLEAERGFRRINHCKDMAKLANILQRISPPPPEEGEKATPSHATLDQEPVTDHKP